MNNALETFYYILNKLFNFLFSAYIFDGVSIGMVMVSALIFGVLFNYLLGVPKMRVADYRPVTTTSMTNEIYKDKNTRISETTYTYKKSR